VGGAVTRVVLEQVSCRRHHEWPDQPVRLGEFERALDVGLRGLRLAEEVVRVRVQQERLHKQQR
jgi:hypothetical protein